MDKHDRFEEWLELVCERHMPQNDMSRIRTFAKELAEGAGKEFWPVNILGGTCRITDPPTNSQNNIALAEIRRGVSALYVEKHLERSIIIEDLIYTADGYPSGQIVNNFLMYVYKRWDFAWPNDGLLRANGFLEGYSLTQVAFALSEIADNSKIFISYKRSESSAFALLVSAKCKNAGLDPFLDMRLIPGEEWHEGLEARIKQYDCLIAVIGKRTLTSEVCVKEIYWAVKYGRRVIPIFHNGFKYNSSKWVLRSEVDAVLQGNHHIRVKEESALGYNAAIDELLNLGFGVMP